jgi:hypothetical protein
MSGKILEVYSCDSCYFFSGDESLCENLMIKVVNSETIPEWCPLPDKNGWLPIESAPKGNLLLLWDGTNYGVGFAAETKEEETATHYMAPSPPEVKP